MHQVGGNVQDLEDEANADIVDTLIDDAFGKSAECCIARSIQIGIVHMSA